MGRLTYKQWLMVAAVVIVVGVALGYWITEDNEGEREYLGWVIVSAVNIVIAAGLLLRFAPATEGDAGPENKLARRGLVLGTVALLTLVVFWTGLPFSFGIPALALGLRGRERAPELGDAGLAAAAIALGAGSVLLCLVAMAVG